MKTAKLVRFSAVLLLLISFLLVLPIHAHAENSGSPEEIFRQQVEASGAEELFDKLPEETRSLLESWGISGISPDTISAITPDSIIDSFLSLISGQAGGPLRTGAVLLGIVLLFALAEGLRETVREDSVSKVFGVICGLAACAALLVPIAGCVQRVCDAAESVSVFMVSFVPVYAGVMTASGNITTALSYQTVVLFAAELITLAATAFIVPLMTASLALGLTGGIAPEYRLGAVSSTINSACSWFLGLSSTLFTGLLSVQSFIGSAADSLTGRAIKFSLGSFLPVVGSSLSDALGTIQGCLNLLRSTLGGVGILATALIVLPPLIECVFWLLALSVCGMAAEMFSLSVLNSLFKSCQGVLRVLIAILASCGIFMIIAAAIVSKGVSAAA